jgi:uncharacterized membrane-anchored protein YhcB (DUF1043 family)
MYSDSHTKVVNMLCCKKQHFVTSRPVIRMHNYKALKCHYATSSGRAIQDVDQRPLAC